VELPVIIVTGERECSEVVMERDAWIPMKITWMPRLAVQPLYLRVAGLSGGELELKVDPSTGGLFQLIVVDAPPLGREWPEVSQAKETCERCGPVIDRSLWSSIENAEDAQWPPPRVTVDAPLQFVLADGSARLRMAGQEVVSWLSCGTVRVGVGSDRELVEVTAIL
jgi:hypothetical protein